MSKIKTVKYIQIPLSVFIDLQTCLFQLGPYPTSGIQIQAIKICRLYDADQFSDLRETKRIVDFITNNSNDIIIDAGYALIPASILE